MLKLIVMVGALASAPAFAKYAKVDTDKVPVDRLVKNLDAKLAKAPKDFELLVRVARVHGLAYAAKVDAVEVRRDDKEVVWFGHEPKHVPFAKRVEAGGSAAHLEKAVDLYRRAESAKPNDLDVTLGLAWCLDQSGKKSEALSRYRKVIEAAYKGDKDWILLVEAIGYARPLLDPKKDAEELARFEERERLAAKQPREMTPVLIDLRGQDQRGDFEELVRRDARVRFDLDGRGTSGDGCGWEWLDPTKAGWLVFDRHFAGDIRSGLQLFGAVSFWLFWRDGYEALAALDDDGNGDLTGPELAEIAVWRDVNLNGQSEPGEIKRLDSYGIAAIETRPKRDPDTGLLRAKAGFFSTWDWVPRCLPDAGSRERAELL